ncbi:hypothetical protein EON68_02525 [archaeon]|nr:MAG: hypothetical protein EON68_02525 [archaeon]
MCACVRVQCPMHKESWCFFGQGVHRHRRAGKSVHTRSLPSRVEKFSYVMLRKTDEVRAPRCSACGFAHKRTPSRSPSPLATCRQPRLSTRRTSGLVGVAVACGHSTTRRWRMPPPRRRMRHASSRRRRWVLPVHRARTTRSALRRLWQRRLQTRACCCCHVATWSPQTGG